MLKRVNFLKWIAVVASLAMFSFTACGATSTTEAGKSGDSTEKAGATEAAGEAVDTVKIAIFYNVTGSAADSGQQDVWGSQLAAKHINESGGIKSLGGAKIELVIGDTMSDVSQAKSVAERVLQDNEIVAAAAAGGSTYLIPMLPVFDKLKVPMCTLNISDKITSQGYQYVFQTVPKGTQFGQLQIEFLDYLGAEHGVDVSKIGILYENSEYGESTAKGSRDLIEKSGKYEVVFDEAFPVGLTDASSLVTALKNSGAQVLLPVAFSQDAKLIYNTMAQMDYSPVSIGGGAGFLFPVFANEMGEAVNGFISTSMINWDTVAVLNNPDFDWIPADYEKEYNEFPTEHSMSSYNSIYMIAQALEAAGKSDRDAVRDALRDIEIKSLQQTPTGITNYDETGWNPCEPIMVQWQKGEDGIFRTYTVFPEKYATNAKYELPAGMKK